MPGRIGIKTPMRLLTLLPAVGLLLLPGCSGPTTELVSIHVSTHYDPSQSARLDFGYARDEPAVCGVVDLFLWDPDRAPTIGGPVVATSSATAPRNAPASAVPRVADGGNRFGGASSAEASASPAPGLCTGHVYQRSRDTNPPVQVPPEGRVSADWGTSYGQDYTLLLDAKGEFNFTLELRGPARVSGYHVDGLVPAGVSKNPCQDYPRGPEYAPRYELYYSTPGLVKDQPTISARLDLAIPFGLGCTETRGYT